MRIIRLRYCFMYTKVDPFIAHSSWPGRHTHPIGWWRHKQRDYFLTFQSLKMKEKKINGAQLNITCPGPNSNKEKLFSFFLNIVNADLTTGKCAPARNMIKSVFFSKQIKIEILMKLRMCKIQQKSITTGKKAAKCQLVNEHGRDKRRYRDYRHCNWSEFGKDRRLPNGNTYHLPVFKLKFFRYRDRYIIVVLSFVSLISNIWTEMNSWVVM